MHYYKYINVIQGSGKFACNDYIFIFEQLCSILYPYASYIELNSLVIFAMNYFYYLLFSQKLYIRFCWDQWGFLLSFMFTLCSLTYFCLHQSRICLFILAFILYFFVQPFNNFCFTLSIFKNEELKGIWVGVADRQETCKHRCQ